MQNKRRKMAVVAVAILAIVTATCFLLVARVPEEHFGVQIPENVSDMKSWTPYKGLIMKPGSVYLRFSRPEVRLIPMKYDIPTLPVAFGLPVLHAQFELVPAQANSWIKEQGFVADLALMSSMSFVTDSIFEQEFSKQFPQYAADHGLLTDKMGFDRTPSVGWGDNAAARQVLLTSQRHAFIGSLPASERDRFLASLKLLVEARLKEWVWPKRPSPITHLRFVCHKRSH